jgi:hypothetical protein
MAPRALEGASLLSVLTWRWCTPLLAKVRVLARSQGLWLSLRGRASHWRSRTSGCVRLQLAQLAALAHVARRPWQELPRALEPDVAHEELCRILEDERHRAPVPPSPALARAGPRWHALALRQCCLWIRRLTQARPLRVSLLRALLRTSWRQLGLAILSTQLAYVFMTATVRAGPRIRRLTTLARERHSSSQLPFATCQARPRLRRSLRTLCVRRT